MLWDTCLDVWIEINHAVPIEIAWWIPQHMRYYRKLWVCVLYMDTVTFNIYYILLNINTKIHLILLKIRRGVIYMFFQCGTSIFTGKTCTVITTKVEIVKLLKYCLRSLKCLQALCKQGRRNSCVREVWLTQGQAGTSATGPSSSTRGRTGLCRAELCGEDPWLLRESDNSATTDEFYLRFKLAMSIPSLASWTQDTVVLRKSPGWVYSLCNYQVSYHLSLYHGYSACQKNLVINIPQDAWEAVMSALHWPVGRVRFVVLFYRLCDM